MDPLECVLRADGPDENDPPGRDGAAVVAGEEVSDVQELVGDADAAGKEQNGAVTLERLQTAVGTFDVTSEGDDAGWRGTGTGVEFGRHARLLGHDHRDGGSSASGKRLVEVL